MKRVVLMTVLSLVPAMAWAQRPETVSVAGVVHDEQGGAVAGAAVEVTCGTAVQRIVADAAGAFRLDDVPRGRCSIAAEAPLFARAERRTVLPAPGAIEIVLPVRSFVSDVVVTATRGRVESAFDSPQATSVVTQDDLAARPFTLLAQALREEPGVLVQQTTTAQTSPVIRGFTGQQNVYLIDGVRLNTASWRGGPSQYFAWVDAAIANRLEVVRGPASVQYGSDALGGTIHVMPASAALGPARVDGQLDLDGATADRSTGGGAQISLQSSKAALRVGLSGRRVGDLRGGGGVDSHAAVTRFLGLSSKDVFGSRMPSTGFDQGAASLTGTLAAGRSGVVTGLYLHNNLTGSSRYDRVDGGNGAFRSGFDPQRLDFAVVRYTHRPADTGTDWSAAVSLNRQSDGRYEQTRPTAVLDAQQSVTTSLGYQLEGGRRVGAHELRAGAEIYRESIEAERTQVSPVTGAATVQRPDIPDGTRYDTFGVFWSDAVRIKRATLRAGLRYGRYAFASVADVNHPSFGVVDEHVVMNAVTFNAGAVYAITRTVNATFNVSRGFRAANSSDLGAIGLSGGGGFEIAPSRAAALGGMVGTTGAAGASSTGVSVPALRPEVLYAFEPGVRVRAGRYSVAATAFDLEYLDNFERRAILFPAGVVGTVISGYEVVRQDAAGLAYVAQDPRPIGTRVNAAHSRIVGFDAEASVEITRAWQGRGYFSMSQGRVLDGDYLSKMPPPLGGAALRWHSRRLWIEGVTMFARAQGRLSVNDLSDARLGASRSRTSIANYFNGSAVDLGYVRNGTLLATGETLAQVQQRLLGDATAAPMLTQLPGFVTVGARGGVQLADAVALTIIGENLTDRSYRFNGSGTDAPGANLQVRVRVRF